MCLIYKSIHICIFLLIGWTSITCTVVAQNDEVYPDLKPLYVDFLPKYRAVSTDFLISKIAYTDQKIVLFFHCVITQEQDTVHFYGQDRSFAWRLVNHNRSDTTQQTETRLAQVHNIRMNDELIRAKLNKRSNTDVVAQRGDIITCEIHFNRFNKSLRSVDLQGGDCAQMNASKNRFNCSGILVKSAESGLLSSSKQMLSNIARFYANIGYVKYPDIAIATTLAQQASLDKKEKGLNTEQRDPFEKYLKPINYMPHGLLGAEDLKCNERVILTDVHFHEKRPDFISRAKAIATLNILIDYLLANNTTKIAVHAHTDIHGNAFNNLEISNQHAQAVKKVLLAKGIDEKRVIAIHHGGAQTLLRYKNGSAMNRRIEVEILCNEVMSQN